MRMIKLCSSLLVLFIFNVAFSSRLNVPRVLLPYKTSIATNYTLEVTDGGCYRWSSSRPDVATITPITYDDSNNECSTKAIVSAVSQSPTRQSTIILASDEGSDTVLKCDVIIDVIHSLEIVTTTKELFLDDAPAAFEVHAKNDQEGTFTSVDGLPFEWKLETKGSKTNSVLRFLTFEASPYETMASVDYWEKQGLKGYIVLVEGIGTGAAGVSVQIQDSNFQDVKEASLTLVVVANLMLNPAHDIYMLPHSNIHYIVELIKQGRPHEIKMPSSQYYLEVKDSDIVSLDSSKSDVTGVAIGSTTILLNDKYTTDLESFRQPSASIHVVTAHTIGFDVRPGSEWVLQTNKQYEIYIRLYTEQNRLIYPSNNMRMKVNFPSKYFDVEFSSKNGTYHVVKTKTVGKTKLNAKLVSVVREDGSEVEVQQVVENDQLVEVYDGVKLTPNELAYPWDPIAKSSYSGRLTVSGGSGNYAWKSSNTSILQVKKDGSFLTQGPGIVKLTVYDANNKLNYDTAKIMVLEVGEIEILPSPVETIVDNQLFIPLAFYGYLDKDKKNKVKFEDCTKLPLDVEFVDRRFFTYDQNAETAPYPGACRTLTFTAKYQGHSRIYVSYGKTLKTTMVIAGFKKLLPSNPVTVAVLPLGASREVAFEGGPRAWVLKEDTHFTRLNIEKKSQVKSVFVRDPHRGNIDMHVFRVTCLTLGETYITLNVGNEPSPTNTMPASQDTRLRISCETPGKLSLKVLTNECKAKKMTCPKSTDSVKVPVQNYEDVRLETVVMDQFGRKMHNVTALRFEWSVSDSSMGMLTDDSDIQVEVNAAKGFQKPIRYYQDFHPRGLEGPVKISAKVLGYKPFVAESGISVTDFKALSASIDLELVEKVGVDDEKKSVFNHPENKAIVKILKGSGHFLVESNDDKLAEINYNEESTLIEILPKQNGVLSLSIYDMCSCNHVTCDVRISNIHTIQVHMSDKVELGKQIDASVTILDEDGHVLSVSSLSLISLQPVPGSNIISVKSTKDENTSKFVVHGEALGHSTLAFQAMSNGKPIMSQQLPIQVFPPFKLHPKNVTLIKGAMFQVSSSGGPEPQLNIQFSMDDGNVAEVTNAGIITASTIGQTKLFAHVSSDDSTGINSATIYSQDQVDVTVVQLTGIKIQTPLTRMQTDSELPIYIVGLSEQQTPFSFGSADPQLDVTWSITNADICSIQSTFHKVTINPSSKNNFAVRLITKRQGDVTVRVVVVDGQGNKFSDEIQLHVFEKLKPKMNDGHGLSVLITHNTETYIKTNRDGIAMMNYKLHAQQVDNLVTIDPRSGKLISNDKTGQAIIQVIAKESFGISQVISIVVMVKPVHYLMITADSRVRSSKGHLDAIPLGLKLKLSVGFFDNVGQKFDATSSNVKHRLSRFDSVQMTPGTDNHTFIVETFKAGQTILKVWDGRISDYISLNVARGIQPNRNVLLTLGQLACFSSNILSDDGHAGLWYTSGNGGNGNALSLLDDSGSIIARDIGSAILHYNVSSSLVTSVNVDVVPITSVHLESDSTNFVTNSFAGQSFNVTVHLKSDHQPYSNDKSCSSRLQEAWTKMPSYAPFTCHISFDSEIGLEAREVFSAFASYDAISGLYQCQIKTITTVPSGLRHQLSTLKADLGITATVLPHGRHQKEIKSNAIKLPFYPQFYVNIDEVTLSNMQTKFKLEITASSRLIGSISVSASDTSLLNVLPGESDAKNAHNLMFPIELKDASALWDTDIYKSDYYVKVQCSANGQRIEVPVKLKLLSSSKCGPEAPKATGWVGLLQAIGNNYQNWLITTLSIIGTIAALFIAYRALFGQPANAALQNSAFLSQSMMMDPRMAHSFETPWTSQHHSHNLTPSPKPYLYSVDNASPRLRKSASPFHHYS